MQLERFGVPPEDREDLLQDAYCALLVAGPSIQELEGYFVVALGNRCKKYWRQRAREAAALHETARRQPRRRRKSPSDAIALQELLAGLTNRERELVVGHDLEEHDYEELSRELGPTPASLRREHSRAINKMRRFARVVAQGTCDVVFTASLAAGASALAQPYPLDEAEFQVNTYTTGFQFPEGIAVDPRGRFIVAWRSDGSASGDTSGFSVQTRRFSKEGAPLDPADLQVNIITGSHQSESAIAASLDGSFVIAWQSELCDPDAGGACIRFRRFGYLGEPLDLEEVQANVYTPGGQRRPAVAARLDGSTVVVWDSNGSPGNDDSGTSIQARRFAADGAPLDPIERQVNTYTTQQQRRPDVGVAPNGDFVVVWDSVWTNGDGYFGIQARRFAADGSPLDANDIQVNSFTTGIQWAPEVAIAPTGDFVVVWESFGSAGGDTSESSVQARRFAADGTPLDASDFQVNTYTPSYQGEADVAVNAEGNFVIAWESWGSLGDDQDIDSVQVRRFRRDGNAIDPVELQVNTLTTDEQSMPVVAAGIDGDFVVAWYSEVPNGTDSSGTSVQARRFGRPTIGVTSTSGGAGDPACTLRDAVEAANAGVAVGGCPAGNEGGIVELPRGATIALAEIDNGANGVPVVERSVTIRGHGARIERDPGLACPLGPEFRLFEVADGGVLTLEDVTVANGCLSAGPGGGVLVGGGTLVLEEASIEGNESGSDGGGLAVVGGNLLAFDSTVRGNLAGGAGGGISVAGDADLLYLSGSTVSENEAGAGGGLHLASDAPLLVRNSTFSGNVAATSGGGIEVDAAGAELGLDFMTVTENSAPVGAGVQVGAGELSLHGSLAGENLGGADCAAGAGTVVASGANLDTDGSCAALAGGSVASVASLALEPLAANGGPTRTHLPLAGSPALDAAPLCATRSGAALIADQRGYSRPSDDDGDLEAECDLGAVERGPLFLDGFESGNAGRWSLTVEAPASG